MSPSAKPHSVREIFVAALDREDETQRRAFLDGACGVGTDRRREVDRLLAAHDAGHPSPLDEAVARFVPTELLAEEPLPKPEIPVSGFPAIGPYKIREQIGEGGFGVVYVAEQTAPVQRRVALKIIKPGMDTKEVVARFEAEKQALAMMDHPNIAKVFDAGTTDSGRPYFVMELIRGMPITRFCREKKLDLRTELKLFVDVCRAVQHAHQKGIIHRDLKPSNILITPHDGEPVVKVIDFGVAKALSQKLTEHTVYTRQAQMIGTPAYMSPEQAELSGLDIDTRSDVYSLGVLLYELLTGVTPFDQQTLMSKGFDEMRRIIREDDPPRPSYRVSTLNVEQQSTLQKERGLDTGEFSHTLKRELDWIVMKALEKKRDRRYESASAFAADVERYLNGDSVQACPPSMRYRLRKFSRRYRTLIATSVLTILSLLIGLVGTSWQTIRARAAEEKANRERQESERSLESALLAIEHLLTHVGNPDLAEIPQLQEVYEKILEDSLEFYDSFVKKHGTSPQLQYRAVMVLTRLGALAYDTDNVPQGADVYGKSIILVDRLVQHDPTRIEYRELEAKVYSEAGSFNAGFPVEASSREKGILQLQRTKSLYHNLWLSEPGNKEYMADEGIVAEKLSYRYEAFNSSDPRISELLEEAYELTERSVPNWLIRERMANLIATKDPDRAYELYHQAMARQQELVCSPSTRKRERATSCCRIAARFSKRHPQEAEQLWREGLGLLKEIVRDFPSSKRASFKLADGAVAYCGFLVSHQRNGEAEQLLSEIARVVEHPYFHRRRADFLASLGTSKDAVRKLTALIESNPKNPEYYRARGRIYLNIDDMNAAQNDLNQAVALAQRIPEYKTAMCHYLFTERSEAHFRRRENEQAVDDATVALKQKPEAGWIYKRRAAAQFELKRYSNALSDLRNGLKWTPADLSTLTWILPEKLAACPDANFRNGFLKLVDETVEKHQHSVASRTTRAVILIAFGRERDALAELNSIATKDDANYYARYQVALLSLKLRDLKLYRTNCEQSLDAVAKSDDAQAIHFAGWTCARAPAGLSDYAPAIRLARTALEEMPEDQQYLIGLGAVQMRAGQFQEALGNLDKAVELSKTAKSSEAYAYYFRAMTEEHLSRRDDARKSLIKANELAEKELNDEALPTAWNRRMTLELLRKEAEALVGQASRSQPPAVAVPGPNR